MSIPTCFGSGECADDRLNEPGGTIALVASRRFEGAITTPQDGGVVADASALRRPRPLLLEFGAASLVVGGLTGVLG